MSKVPKSKTNLEQSAIRWIPLVAFVLRQKQDSRVIRDLGLVADDSKLKIRMVFKDQK